LCGSGYADFDKCVHRHLAHFFVVSLEQGDERCDSTRIADLAECFCCRTTSQSVLILEYGDERCDSARIANLAERFHRRIAAVMLKRKDQRIDCAEITDPSK